MKNLNYFPETSHLPGPKDLLNWKRGGREIEKAKQDALKRFKEKWEITYGKTS